MKKQEAMILMILLIIIDTILVYFIFIRKDIIISSSNEVIKEGVYAYDKNIEAVISEVEESTLEQEMIEENKGDPIIYDGLTLKELTDKLERNLNSDLKGYGYIFASYAVELGIDPYLSLAIALHETGCKWNCSTLVKKYNNVGGMKKTSQSYQSFPTLEEGIKKYLDNLYYNYYQYGLTTPEAMNAKYAESKTWASQVQVYINQIKNS